MNPIYIILALVALGVLVFIHELGHFLVAKLVGMKVEVFSIGFGKPILKWQWRGVNWQVGCLPFGGFVKIAGMEFGKKEQGQTVEPYDIKEGFFSKPPLARMAVAFAGPFANFVLAFLCFVGIFAFGGRHKPFSEFTQVVGWVEPSSDLFSLGLRPGDLLCEFNGKPYSGANDLLMASLFGPKKSTAAGEHIDYFHQTKTPYCYNIETTPIGKNEEKPFSPPLSGARYLIYDRIGKSQENPLMAGSPMEASGICYGDRIVWADGTLIFSVDELGRLLNDERSFLLVKRGDHTFFSRQRAVLSDELVMPTQLRQELLDWSYEAGLKKRWTQLKVLPYALSSDAVIEEPLNFIEEEAKRQTFPSVAFSKGLEEPLQKGDKIVAVDGFPITKSYELLNLLQTRHLHLIVEKEVPLFSSVLWKQEDEHFLKSFDVEAIQKIAKSIGTQEPLKEAGRYHLLNPVEPKRISEFQTNGNKKEIPEKENRYLLAIYLQDQEVVYNPTPLFLFGSTLVQTGQTLKALVVGQLHPKYLTGPIGIVQVIHRSWELGIKEAVFWVGLISLNLGFFNLLPLPILDGGYILMSLFEMITGRRLKAKTMERIIIPFVVLLIALILFVTFYDVSRLLH